jgi:uncharacterized cupredoxin-like copper-binding protein
MTARWAALAALPFILVAAACAGPAATPTAASTATPTAAPTALPTAAPTPSPGALRIEVELTDALTMDPAQMTVPRGVPVTFVVTNSGALDHEFYLGDAAMQADHAQEMLEMGGMMAHDEENGIAVDPGEMKELTYTFAAAGEWLAGCHVNGHYDAGMLATIMITD